LKKKAGASKEEKANPRKWQVAIDALDVFRQIMKHIEDRGSKFPMNSCGDPKKVSELS
jgi:hypothetical protein